ncbi:MAG TPA: hypothetical protein VMI75_05500 [Polyangiaceae bacterium]|nr:hypothetical protein [Polyangiaceae bacterium]
MILRSLRVGGLLLLPAAIALAADCGGDPFAAGAAGDASTGGSSGSGSGSDGSGSSSGGSDDASACTPSTGSMMCDTCVAKHCDSQWCACAGDKTLHNGAPGCLTYVECVDACLATGGTSPVCTTHCAPGYSASEKGDGDSLLGCIALECLDACKSGSSSGSSSGVTSSSGSSGGVSSSSSGGSTSSSGMSSSSSGASSSSSGASSSSSGGPSSSSGGKDSGSGGMGDGGVVCVCVGCTGAQVCCMLGTSTNCGKCVDPACASCCM